MQSKVAPFAAARDSTYGRPAANPASGGGGAAEAAETTAEADIRLVILEDEASGAFIYKTINRRTGEILQVFLREEIERMGDEADYHAGEVIRTKA